MDFIVTILEQGLIYAILALGVYITYKILDFPDLTVDGSFPLGAAVTAALITRGMNPYLTLPVSFLAGVLAGVCTGLIHVKCKVRDLLSGIIMMTALWTVNLYIAGTANVPLFSRDIIFKNDFLIEIVPESMKSYVTLIIVLILAVVCKIILDLYMNTKSGYLLRAVGDNETVVTALAKDQGNVKILGLAIANGLVSLAGCVFAQEERVFEISMGTGAIVIGLAAVIISEVIFGKFCAHRKAAFAFTLGAVFIGAILYYLVIALVLWLKMPSDYMKLFSAVVVACFLAVPYMKDTYFKKGRAK